jgi:predicted phage tail protein
VRLVWTDNSNNESGFVIERAMDVNFTNPTVFPTTAANVAHFTDTTVGISTTYWYRVRAVNLGGPSTNATAGPVTTAGLLSAAPTSLSATPVGPPLQINLAWLDNSNSESGFRIERAVGAGAFAPLTTTLPNVTAYTDTAVTMGTSYLYRVFAINASGDSAPSNTVLTSAPTAPTNLVATASALNVTPPLVNLTWTDNSSNEVNFKVQRATDPGFTVGLTDTTLAANVTAYTDATVAPIMQYFYRVLAINALGSSMSNVAMATTTAEMLTAPVNLVATASAPGIYPPSVHLTWTDTSGTATSFTIQRAYDALFSVGLTTFQSTGANPTAFTDKPVAPETTYYYRVISLNGLGSSSPSNTATVTTGLGPIYFPLILKP